MNVNSILQKIVDLIPLDQSDIEFIQTLNEHDKLLIIKIYIETLNQIIQFIEDFL